MCENIKKKGILIIESVDQGIPFLYITYVIIFTFCQNYF